MVALGCPHCSAEELEKIAGLLQGKKVQKELWVCTARKIADAHPHLVAAIEESGARVFCDTCMVVSPATERFDQDDDKFRQGAGLPARSGRRSGWSWEAWKSALM